MIDEQHLILQHLLLLCYVSLCFHVAGILREIHRVKKTIEEEKKKEKQMYSRMFAS